MSHKFFLRIFFLIPILTILFSCAKAPKKIGVIYAVHGGQEVEKPQYMFDAVIQQFSYDKNHPIYQFVMWKRKNWPLVLNSPMSEYAKSFLRKYRFEYKRIGGIDPFYQITEKQLSNLKRELESNEEGLEFEVELGAWMGGSHPEYLPYPRFFLNPPPGGDKITYCGEGEKDGPWKDCNPNRYDVDGPVERLLQKGVSKIIVADMTVGGVRFSKTFEFVQRAKEVLDKWNNNHKKAIPLIWVNDYKNLMERSYPEKPEGWTRSLGIPDKDRHIPLEGYPNPIAEDIKLAELNVVGIEKRFNKSVSDADTAVLLLNHALHENDESFDPKINDTVLLNKNIKKILLQRHPTMKAENIIGAFFGVKELNPKNGLVERTRRMRGQTLGSAWLYESNKQLPTEEWGYRYWDALEYLKKRGAKHIVIAFPQIVTDSVLNLVEIYCQIAVEIGTRTWARFDEGDYKTYPLEGNPFPDYWGVWVNTKCGDEDCCFEMGGCDDGRPYPPPRQTPLKKARGMLDPSLAFDLSGYGHLGYDPAKGKPNPNKPVQNQYRGTWDLWIPINDDPQLAKILAKHIIDAAKGNLK